MPELRSLLSRRWLLGVLGVAALLFGLTMLHPYPRQSLFGPTIRGKPWCYWEGEVRWRTLSFEEHQNTLSAKLTRWFGVPEHDPIKWEELCDHPDMLPLFLHLASRFSRSPLTSAEKTSRASMAPGSRPREASG
ncbi:MAG: hypothetical protein HYR84_16150 [Planctomycetes bacterium]|nr:hypothetical protein [Planctomycetota bacterium]